MSKKFLRTLAAVLLVFCMLPLPTALAESATVTGSDVNMRSGPGVNYAVIDCLDKGEVVTVTDRSDPSWYAITYHGVDGYMSSRYLSIIDEPVTAPSAAPSRTNGHINAMYVRFRSGPSSDSAILGEYNNGKPLIATGTVNGWVSCIIDGRSGYVFGEYVTLTDGQSSPRDPSSPPDDLGDPPATPSPTPDPDDVIVVEDPQPETPTGGRKGYIDGDGVRFRNGPGTNYGILDTYDRGKELTITGETNGWTACIIDGQSGYVYSKYVKEVTETPENPSNPDPSPTPTPTPTPAPTTPPTSGKKGYITGNNVRFRAGPSSLSEIYCELFYGNVVTITGETNGWTAVIYNGQSGYVYSQYVAEGEYGTNPPDPGPPTPSGNVTGQQVADYALQFVGYKYVWGGASPQTGFDCSGLVYYVYGQFGYTLNRVAADQALNGVHVDPSDLRPGDILCFYSGDNYIGHVGIYVGGNKFVHAANSQTGVVVTELSGYYAGRGYEARRIIT